jgi:hypothetical protein
MTGPAHYAEAERLIAAAKTSSDHFYGEQDAIPTLLAALVHAVLGAAAATALGDEAREIGPWRDVAASKLSSP